MVLLAVRRQRVVHPLVGGRWGRRCECFEKEDEWESGLDMKRGGNSKTVDVHVRL